MKKYYTEKGYDVGKRGTFFEIKVEDLSPNSNADVLVLCDFCENEHTMKYCKYLSTVESGNCCYECRPKKQEKTNMIRYGVRNTSQLEFIQEKRKNTCMEKYGFPSNSMSEISKDKMRKTNLAKYGTEYYFNTEEFKEKSKKSNLERYGFSNGMKSEIVKSKVRNSLYENSTCPSSKGQRHLCELYDGILNYPMGWYNLDIYLPFCDIYIEYQGSGHKLNLKRGKITEEEFIKKEIIRYNYLKKQELKMIEFINISDKLPSDEIMLSLLDYCLKYFEESKRNYISIDLDNLENNKF